jgi:hypothetical protein
MLRLVSRFFIGLITALSVLALLSPWLLYEAGLLNVVGRPSMSPVKKIAKTDAIAIWSELKESGPIRIERMTPYSYVKSLIKEEPMSSGANTAWYVARDYNTSNLRNKKAIWWHVSGAAMTIWLTRHWSADELLAKAGEIHRVKALAFNSPVNPDTAQVPRRLP